MDCYFWDLIDNSATEVYMIALFRGAEHWNYKFRGAVFDHDMATVGRSDRYMGSSRMEILLKK